MHFILQVEPPLRVWLYGMSYKMSILHTVLEPALFQLTVHYGLLLNRVQDAHLIS